MWYLFLIIWLSKHLLLVFHIVGCILRYLTNQLLNKTTITKFLQSDYKKNCQPCFRKKNQ
ncbi:hypothetical protein WG68_06805 [Arsukibacterium ikkense]|uniref:Uncharacterized protein n=1 Tax=Arsukibacterium ikkense TaxID=336831 RepID=A0A0M2V8T2_9GAMM|nr:hypothetical protein WG68_06805 [Arsukibacterium ikkense]